MAEKKLSWKTGRAMLEYLRLRNYELIGCIADGVGDEEDHWEELKDRIFADPDKEYGPIWVVAKDNEEFPEGIVFIRLCETDGDLDIGIDRKELEQVMIDWLTYNYSEDGLIRGDVLLIKRLNKDHAILKHHIDAFHYNK